jgi:hypothetical protein
MTFIELPASFSEELARMCVTTIKALVFCEFPTTNDEESPNPVTIKTMCQYLTTRKGQTTGEGFLVKYLDECLAAYLGHVAPLVPAVGVPPPTPGLSVAAMVTRWQTILHDFPELTGGAAHLVRMFKQELSGKLHVIISSLYKHSTKSGLIKEFEENDGLFCFHFGLASVPPPPRGMKRRKRVAPTNPTTQAKRRKAIQQSLIISPSLFSTHDYTVDFLSTFQLAM